LELVTWFQEIATTSPPPLSTTTPNPCHFQIIASHDLEAVPSLHWVQVGTGDDRARVVDNDAGEDVTLIRRCQILLRGKDHIRSQ